MKSLNKLKELHAKTTQGKWEWKCSYDFHKHEHKGFKTECENVSEGRMHLASGDEVVLREWADYASDCGISVDKSDAEFIAEAHKMVPRLIEALEKAIEQRDVLISDYGLRNNLSIIDIKENIDKELEQILEGKE